MRKKHFKNHSRVSAHQNSWIEHLLHLFVHGDSLNPSLLVKQLFTLVIPHRGYHSSWEQMGKLWMTKAVSVHSRNKSVQEDPRHLIA